MRIACFLVCTVLLASPTVIGKENRPPPSTDLEWFADKLQRVRVNILNSQARVRNGVVSMGGDEVDPSKPAMVCCSRNIERIERQIFAMGPYLRSLHECYVAELDVDSQVQLGIVRADAESMFRAMRNFRDSDHRRFAFALEAMTKAFVLLEKSYKQLAECGAPTSERDAAP